MSNIAHKRKEPTILKRYYDILNDGEFRVKITSNVTPREM